MYIITRYTGMYNYVTWSVASAARPPWTGNAWSTSVHHRSRRDLGVPAALRQQTGLGERLQHHRMRKLPAVQPSGQCVQHASKYLRLQRVNTHIAPPPQVLLANHNERMITEMSAVCSGTYVPRGECWKSMMLEDATSPTVQMTS